MDTLAVKTGMDRESLKPLIKSMEKKGTLYTEPGSEDPTYRPLGMEAPGLAETSAWGDVSNPFKKRLIGLWSKFWPIYVDEAIAELGQHMRAWCMVSALPSDARPEENLFDQIRSRADHIAVTGCPCRLIARHGDDRDPCDCLIDCCMCFGELARWSIEQGHGRHITQDEAIEILRACEVKGQIHSGLPSYIVCNCCKHACVNLYAMKLGKTHAYSQNHFFAVVNAESCTSCEICVERCPVGAIQMETTPVVDGTKCIGCGACASGCQEESIRMARRSEEEIARLDAEYSQAFGKVISMTKPDPLMLKLGT